MTRKGWTSVLLMVVLGLAWASPARAENSPAGVVTAVHGTATVTRASLPEPGPLKFRDSVFTRDRITTGDRSFARVLLGGKALVTARERSVLTITTVPGTATVEARSGKVAVAVAKSLNPSGETIAIRTRNAVVAVRGTVVVAEVVPGAAADGTLDRTVFTVLRGVVDVYALDPTSGQAGPGRRLGALQRASFAGVAAPQTAPVTAAEAKRLAAEFTMPMAEAKTATSTATSSVARAHVAKAASEIEGLLRSSETSTSSSRTTSTTSLTGAKTADSGSLTSDSTILHSDVLSAGRNLTIGNLLKSGLVREELDSSTLESETSESTLKTSKW
jgi:hypothetical protein